MSYASLKSETPTLYGVGVGPGDPDLITIKATKILQKISVIAFPSPQEGRSLTHDIAIPHLNPNAEKIPLRMPIDVGTPSFGVYSDWYEIIIPHLESGKDVAILCEGDPLLYGSFQYIMKIIKPAFHIEIIPGISSLNSAAAAAKIALCSYHQHLHLISATDNIKNINHILSLNYPCAILKVGKKLISIRNVIRENNRENLSIVVSYASWNNQKIIPLNDIPISENSIPYFSIILIPSREQT